MQKTTDVKNGKLMFLFHLFSLLIRFDCLVMYYAAGLTLNTVFAGISSPVVSVPALAVAAGAILGRYLFQRFRDVLLDEAEEISEKSRERALVQELAVSDLIAAVSSFVLFGKGALIPAAGLCAVWIIRFFFTHLQEWEMPAVTASFALGGLAAVSAMKTGRAGLYGVIMYCLIFMDVIRMHRHTAKRDGKGESDEPVTVLLLTAAKICTAGIFLIIVKETCRVLAYRIAMNRAVSIAMIACVSLAAGILSAVCERRSGSLKAERISSALSAAVTVVYCLSVNPYCGMLCASGSLAVLAMPVLVSRFSLTEDTETVWHGVFSFLFLSLLIAGCYLLYWGGRAPFDDILVNVILYMTVSMHAAIRDSHQEELIYGDMEFTEDTSDHLADSDQHDQSPDVRE